MRGFSPSPRASVFVEGIDARAPGENKAPAGPPFRDHTNLRQLYFQLGADDDPQLLRAGRLEMAFGDGRLVGSLPWANTARTFDGARATFGGKGYRVDAFAASVVRVYQGKFDRSIPGNNFYGVYGTPTKLGPMVRKAGTRSGIAAVSTVFDLTAGVPQHIVAGTFH